MTATVLIADDQSDVREALVALVAVEPRLRVVAAAADAEEAVRLAREHHPDIALVDVSMPEGGGVRATRGIREHCPETRIVALSAYDDRESVLQLLEAGAVGYLVKGSAGASICEALVRVVHGQSVVAPEVAAGVVHELAGRLAEQSAAEEQRRMRLATVRQAFEPGVLSVVFQPIVELGTGSPIGYEALARFDLEPRRPPNEWFADAAEAGLGVGLELLALRAALGQLPGLPAGAFLSVNVSAAALLAPELHEILAVSPCERLVLETTEHAAVDDYEAVTRAMAPLRSRGCRFAVDDAGAGFASLRHVLHLSPDVLKLDGSVVCQIDSKRAARALTSALLAFAHEMELTVVAEGIESSRTVRVLKALGVRHGQGNYLGRPGPLP